MREGGRRAGGRRDVHLSIEMPTKWKELIRLLDSLATDGAVWA